MTTGQPVRIGVIGGGFGIQHLQGFSATEDAEVVAFCQRTKDKAEATAKAFGVTHVYTDYRRLLGHPGLDAVSVVAPPHLHAEMVAAALDQGLHLLCEKPLAMDAAQAETMLSRAEAAGRVHMTAFNHRHIPALAYMKELLDGGYVGERVYHVESRWFSENRATPGLTHYWRHQRELAGFGVMGDIGVHVVDRIRWLVGEFESVWGHADTFIPERPDEDGTPQPVTVEDSFTLLGRLAAGASACVRLSAVARKSNYQNLEVYGDAGMLRFVFDRNVGGLGAGPALGRPRRHAFTRGVGNSRPLHPRARRLRPPTRPGRVHLRQTHARLRGRHPQRHPRRAELRRRPRRPARARRRAARGGGRTAGPRVRPADAPFRDAHPFVLSMAKRSRSAAFSVPAAKMNSVKSEETTTRRVEELYGKPVAPTLDKDWNSDNVKNEAKAIERDVTQKNPDTQRFFREARKAQSMAMLKYRAAQGVAVLGVAGVAGLSRDAYRQFSVGLADVERPDSERESSALFSDRRRTGQGRAVNDLGRHRCKAFLESAEPWFVDSRCRRDHIPAHADSQKAFHRLYLAAPQAFFPALRPAFLQKFLSV